MAKLPIFQVDAFTRSPFSGNPAAVCPVEEWPETGLMQAIAAETNLSETVFLRSLAEYVELRFFTPTIEVPLCGHATLAAAHVLFGSCSAPELVMRCPGGTLQVKQLSDGRIEMRLPRTPPEAIEPAPSLIAALGAEPLAVLRSRDVVAVYSSQDEVRSLRPDLAALGELVPFGLAATAPGSGHDFVLRFFAPAIGIAEDPVTGSAQCTLAPYWAERLQRKVLRSRQLSQRGGELFATDESDCVLVSGHAIQVMSGTYDL